MKRLTPLLVLGIFAGVASAEEGSNQVPAYLISNFDVTNKEGYQSYLGAVGSTIRSNGGGLLVAGPGSEVVKGDLGAMTVVVKFPSMQASRRWYESPKYQEIKSLRTDNTEGALVFANEFVRP